MRKLLSIFLIGITASASGQYTTRNAHAHNDYEHTVPFYTAYHQRFGSIEADIFERNGQLFVSHDTAHISSERTLEKLYLHPLQNIIKKNGGTAYAGSRDTLQLLIDFKTAGVPTMRTLLQQLEQYPEIIHNATVQIVISGNQPEPALWPQYPGYIYFDGKRNGHYTAAQLARIPLYSTDIRSFTSWNGAGVMVKAEQQKMQQWVDSVHHIGKKTRLWGVPDTMNAWRTQMNMGLDYIGTDLIEGLSGLLHSLPTAEYRAAQAKQR